MQTQKSNNFSHIALTYIMLCFFITMGNIAIFTSATGTFGKELP